MATETETWEIVDGELVEAKSRMADGARTEAVDLESWLASHSVIIGSDVAIIGRQVQTRSGPLDLLGIDKSGNVVVVELKRNRLPRDALAQAIDYASDIANWSIDKLSEVCTDYTGKTLEDFLSEAFEDISIEGVTINQEQRILLVGFRVEESLERMITWLSDGYSVSINAIVLNYVRTHRGGELLVKTTIIPEELAQARTN